MRDKMEHHNTVFHKHKLLSLSSMVETYGRESRYRHVVRIFTLIYVYYVYVKVKDKGVIPTFQRNDKACLTLNIHTN